MEETLTFVFEKLKATVKISGGEAQAWFSRTIQPGSISHWNLALRNSGTAAAAWLDRICPSETRSSVLLAVKSSGTAATAWLDHILPPETRARWLLAAKSSGTAAAAWLDQILPPETRARWLLAAKNTGGEAMAWFDEVFPPETRVEKIGQWIQVAKPYLIAAVVLWVVFRLFPGGGGGKTMKAPGRNYRMRRSTFESNPKGYFSDLRGGR